MRHRDMEVSVQVEAGRSHQAAADVCERTASGGPSNTAAIAVFPSEGGDPTSSKTSGVSAESMPLPTR
jgi:hypothetical protein